MPILNKQTLSVRGVVWNGIFGAVLASRVAEMIRWKAYCKDKPTFAKWRIDRIYALEECSLTVYSTLDLVHGWLIYRPRSLFRLVDRRGHEGVNESARTAPD